MQNPTVLFPHPNRVEVQDLPIPTPETGEVVIRSSCSLISAGTELTSLAKDAHGAVWKAMFQNQGGVGYANVGRVHAVGTGIDSALIGRRVLSSGRHAAFVSIAADTLVPLPDSVSDEAATMIPLAYIASNGVRRAGLTWGESVLVVGMGLLGHLVSRLCALAGAARVLAYSRSPERLNWLPKQPWYQGFAGEAEALSQTAPAHNGDRVADVVFDVTGDAAAINQALRLVRPQGRVLLLGSPRAAAMVDLHDLCVFPSVSIIGAHAQSGMHAATPDDPWNVARYAELLLGYIASKRLAVEDLVSHSFPAARAAEAYELLRTRKEPVLGVTLQWGDAGL